MEPHSSIFSSETLAGGFRPGKATAIAVAMVIVARVLLSPLRDLPDYDNADFSRFVAVKKYELSDRTEAASVPAAW